MIDTLELCLEEEIRITPSRVIVPNVLNKRAVEWGMPPTNMRGQYNFQMAARTDVHVFNLGNFSGTFLWTEIVDLTKKHMLTTIPMHVVDPKPAAKYIGVTIDGKVDFGENT